MVMASKRFAFRDEVSKSPSAFASQKKIAGSSEGNALRSSVSEMETAFWLAKMVG